MNREQKGIEVENLKNTINAAQFAVLTDYQGIEVNNLNDLRRKLEEKEAKFKIIKNRLAKIAVKGTDNEVLSEHLSGTTALSTTESDPSALAKALVDFAKEHEQIKFKTALINGALITHKDFQALANLPSREELIAKAMGSMMAPARNWVSVLAQIPRQLVNVLAAVRDKKEKES